MSFERLPLALALSITLIGGGLLNSGGTPAFARQTLGGHASASGYQSASGSTLLIAAKDSGDVSADSPAKNGSADKGKDSDKPKDKDKDKDKGKAKEKAAKDEKKDSDKGAKKDKKAEKAEKDSKEQASADDGGDKKKKGGLFHHRAAADEKAPAAEDKAKEEKPVAKAREEKPAAEEKDAAKSKIEAKAAPAFVPDDALISVLKDISRALADGQNEQVQKLENANEKMILGMAQEILAKALAEPTLSANRIVPKTDERQVKSALTAESWSSGDVVVNDQLRGSLAAVWAKRIGGLLTVTIAGDAGTRKSNEGKPIGEFMVVVSAHSPVQSGFDIQSQSDVTFWMGKLNAISVEANCVPTADTATDDKAGGDKADAAAPDKSNTSADASNTTDGAAKKKAVISLSPLLTDRYRKHYAALLAADLDAQKVAAALAAAADPSTRQAAAAETSSEEEKGAAEKEVATETADSAKSGKAEVTGKAEAMAGDDAKNVARPAPKMTTVASATNASSTPTVAMTELPRFHMPSVKSMLLMPERALAGQYVTVALLDHNRTPEPNVELSFNGASLVTDSNGQAVYQIPDDATPGRSLNVALSARPDDVPAIIEVLQPLNMTNGQPPRLDRMTPLATRGSIMIIEGHNFDGMAHNNSVIVDGSLDGRIVSASPFQLKVLLPTGLRPGEHSLCASTDGMRSNLARFEYADTLVEVAGKDTGKENAPIKLVVKVIGTTAKLNVKIINQTPDVVRLNRGAEMTITSSGGFDNCIQLPAVRGKKGTFQIDTRIEI